MLRRLSGAIAVLAVVGALAGAAVAYAAGTGTSTPSAPSTSPPAYGPMPAASNDHHGNCPGMGGGSSGSGGSSDSGGSSSYGL
jgi:hypothetical protein